MLRNTLLTLCMAIPLTGCEVLMLGNVVVGCAIRPAPELLPKELPAAVVGAPYSIRIDVINASTPMTQLLVAPDKPLPNGLELTHIEREKHGVIQGTQREGHWYIEQSRVLGWLRLLPADELSVPEQNYSHKQ